MNVDRINGVIAKVQDDADGIMGSLSDMRERIEEHHKLSHRKLAPLSEEARQQIEAEVSQELAAIHSLAGELRETVGNALREELGVELDD